MPAFDVRSVVLPYCIQRTADGRYIFLNRDYKPVGFFKPGMVDYTAYPISVPIKGLTKSVAKRLSAKGSDETNEIFLYDDGCVPTDSEADMKKYLEKLAILMKLRIGSSDG